MNREERREFVAKHRTAVFGYGRKHDGPAQSIVYYVMDGDDILVSTMGARAKAKAVERPPKHVHQASDVNEKLLHDLGDSLPW